MNKKLIRNIIVGVGVLVVVVLIFRNDKIKALPVKEVEIKEHVVTKTITSSGEVTAQKYVELGFGIIGDIALLSVKEGDTVSKGTLLVTLDSSTLYQAMQAAKDARDIALRDRDLYVENYSTNLNAVGGEDEYYIAIRRQNELVSQYEATYQSKLSTYRDAFIYAPFDGVVLDITKEVGETVTASEVVVKMADTSKLQFEIELDQEGYGIIELNQSAEITLDAYEGTTFEGFITELPYYANGGDSTSLAVKIDFNASREKMPLVGMTGDVHIDVVSTNEPVPSVLYDEINYDEVDAPFLWILENGLIKKLPVEIGMEGDIYTQILTDLTNRTVVTGQNDDVELGEGYKAKFVN